MNRKATLIPVIAIVAGLLGGACTKSDCPDCNCPALEQQSCPACNCPAPQEPTCPDCNGATAPTLLSNYDDILAALQGGKNLRLVFYYERCVLNGQGWGPNAVGGMPADVFEWFDRGVVYNDLAYVSMSSAKLIRLGAKMVYNYGKVRLYEDGKVQVEVEYIDPVSFDSTMRETFDCELSTSNSPKGAAVFAL